MYQNKLIKKAGINQLTAYIVLSNFKSDKFLYKVLRNEAIAKNKLTTSNIFNNILKSIC